MSQLATTLKNFFEKQKTKNPKLSIRKLADKIHVSPSLLTMIFKGQRQPSVKILNLLISELELDLETAEKLKATLLTTKFDDISLDTVKQARAISDKNTDASWALANEAQFVALKSWHYFSIMQVTLLKTYDGTVEYIADFLNLDTELTRKYFEELKEVGLLTFSNEKKVFTKAHIKMEYQSQHRSQLRAHHVSCMNKVIQEMNHNQSEYNKNNRFITSSSFSCKGEQIPLIKQKIAQFIKEVADTDETEGHDEVCLFSIQLLPLSSR